MKIVRGNKDKEVKSITYKLYDTEGENSLIVLTPRMRSALLSSVEMISWKTRHEAIPSDLSSPDDFQSWIDTLRYNLMNPLDFCSLMIENSECFFTDETVQNNFDNSVINSLNNQDIIDRLTNIYNTYNNPVSPQEMNANLFNDECNFDAIYAQVVQLVDTLDGLSQDILQLVTQVSGVYDRVTTMISAIPVVEATPLPAIFDFVENVIEGVRTEYEGTYTESLELELKCEIFCLIKNSSSCEFNFTQILAFYLGKLNTEISGIDPIELVNDVFNYLVSGDIDGDITVFAMHAFACSVLASGSSFLGETFTGLVTLIYAQRDESNNDWIELCDECDEPEPPDENCTDFTSEQGLWSVLDSGTIWEDGTGYKGSFYAPIYYIPQIKRATGVVGSITKVIIRANIGMDDVRLVSPDNSIYYYGYVGTPLNEIEFSIDTFPFWTNLDSNNSIGFRVQFNNNNASSRITEVCVYLA